MFLCDIKRLRSKARNESAQNHFFPHFYLFMLQQNKLKPCFTTIRLRQIQAEHYSATTLTIQSIAKTPQTVIHRLLFEMEL